MNKELKIFFQKLEKENPYDYFLLKKLYYSPDSILSDSKEYVDVGFYYDEDLAYKYMFNNNLLEFLDLAYDDEEFLNKMNYYMFICLENLLDRTEEISILFIENDFTYKSVYKYIKSRFENKNLYSDKTIINKIKRYNLDLSNKILEKTIDFIYMHKPVDTNNNQKNNNDKKILLFFKGDENEF